MKSLDLIILPAEFADPTTALRPFAIAIEFGERGESVCRAEDQIRRHILVNDTGYSGITPQGLYYMWPGQWIWRIRKMSTGTHSSLLWPDHNRNRIWMKYLGPWALGEPWLWDIWDEMQSRYEQQIRKTKRSQEEFPRPSSTILHLEGQRVEKGYQTARHKSACLNLRVLNTRWRRPQRNYKVIFTAFQGRSK